MPTNAPYVSHVMQGGEKGVGIGSSKVAGSGSSKDFDGEKVVGKVFSTQIPTSLPTSLSTTLTTMTSRCLTKGIVIG